jgi:hypothetical protein
MSAAPDATPRGAHLEMVGAVLAGDGLERVAEIAAAQAGAPVAVIVPRLGVPLEGRPPGRRASTAPGRDHGGGADLVRRA